MLLGVSTVLVLARLFLRTIRQSQNLTISDWLLVASLLDAAALFGTDTAAYNLGGMDEYDPNEPERSIEDQITLMKVSFAGNYFYDTGVYFPKLALLALYFKLIPQTMPVLRKALYGVTALTGTFMVTTCFLDTFWCGSKVSLNWEIDSSCTTFDSKDVFRIDWGLNFLSDMLGAFGLCRISRLPKPLANRMMIVFTLPFPLLFGLQISKRYMAGLVAIFASGLITLGASIARFATVESIHAWTNVCKSSPSPGLRYLSIPRLTKM